MKKLFFILGFSAIAFGLTSCACECVGANDGDPTNKICKTEYEAFYGAGTWASYESNAKSVGWVCK